MYAVIETGGKQYRVKEGDVIVVEKLKAEVGSQVEFDKVLMLGEKDGVLLGQPYLDAVVKAKVLDAGKAEKIVVFKYKSKKNYRKKQGHRQPYSELEIISLGKLSVTDKNKTAVKAEEGGLPNFKTMKKAEICQFAKDHNIEINEKDTIPVIVETITKAMK